MRIAILYGGWSPEREISLISGRNVYEALKRKGYDAILIDVKEDFFDKIKEEKIDIAFNILHGTPGEDGIMQGVLEFLKIPYVGSGIEGAVLSMDKIASKKIFVASGIPTPDFIYPVDEKNIKIDKFPVVVKPRYQGSSVGVSIVDSYKDLKIAIEDAKKYGEYFIEEYIDGMIATCGILGDTPLPILELVPKRRRFYDYYAKYTEGETEFICPARLDDGTTKYIQDISLKVHKLLSLRHFSRVDLMIKNGKFPYVLEANSIPGMTPLSDLPKEAATFGIFYDDLVERILKFALDYKNEKY